MTNRELKLCGKLLNCLVKGFGNKTNFDMAIARVDTWISIYAIKQAFKDYNLYLHSFMQEIENEL